jgi:succinate dehydrogenase/fumarate reductase cytochrome b subunit
MDPIAIRLIVIVFFIAIIYNLGAALYYMMHDKGDGKRMAWALTRRIGLSVLLIALVMLGIWTGLIEPHGIYPTR